jgi:hypothetical protein
MPVKTPKKGAMRAILLSFVVLIFQSVTGHAQSARFAIWFSMGSPETDDVANETVHVLSSGMSDIILALDGGRKRGLPVDPEKAQTAKTEMQAASKGFLSLSDRLAGHPIDLQTIKNLKMEYQYYELINLIKQNGYKQPTDWKSYLMLLSSIADKVVTDLDAMIKPKDLPGLQNAFFDLISQKVLLEKIGASSGFITISMQ